MRQFTYVAIRKAPAGLTAAFAFLISIWAAVDPASLQSQYIYTRDNILVRETGILIASTLALYFFALWFTRHWNRTDRDFYRDNLRRIYADIANHVVACGIAATDQDWGAAYARFGAALLAHRGWIEKNMGAAAASKFLHRSLPGMAYPWPGNHSPAIVEQRNSLLSGWRDMAAAIDAMMASDNWDDASSLAERVSAEKWKTRREWIWSIRPMRWLASMRS